MVVRAGALALMIGFGFSASANADEAYPKTRMKEMSIT